MVFLFLKTIFSLNSWLAVSSVLINTARVTASKEYIYVTAEVIAPPTNRMPTANRWLITQFDWSI